MYRPFIRGTNLLHKCQSSSWETFNLRVIELQKIQQKKFQSIPEQQASPGPRLLTQSYLQKWLHFFLMYLLIHNKVAGKRLDLLALRMGRALPRLQEMRLAQKAEA
ncbi:hypothetical protein JTE90_016914 [Oedothorax gibbosus]|uniref:Uncharacterized protein n=1 Tax=Oedothorax gibbosus TaxID=931172 RepID=A0AAV6UVU8_9ARAC|nr:hypothetical protein JTE90_016914 [Oedothorax gibbosus]